MEEGILYILHGSDMYNIDVHISIYISIIHTLIYFPLLCFSSNDKWPLVKIFEYSFLFVKRFSFAYYLYSMYREGIQYLCVGWSDSVNKITLFADIPFYTVLNVTEIAYCIEVGVLNSKVLLLFVWVDRSCWHKDPLAACLVGQVLDSQIILTLWERVTALGAEVVILNRVHVASSIDC
jgi:hypothetical protein